ncbi:MAG: class I SAM-dependent methyltransferase [Akkermansiaceae bacterium]
MYTDLEAKLHDTFWEQEDIISELPLLEKFHDKKPSLEIGCGSGRLLLPLLENGTPIDGVEISPEMVQLLHSNAQQQNLTSKLAQQTIHTADIVDLNLDDKKYQRVSIPAFTAQLLTRENFQKLLTQAHTYTTPDAKLYLTLFIPWAEIAGELPESDWYLDHEANLGDDGKAKAQCKTKFTINRLRQTLSRKHQYTVTHPSGQKQQHRSSQEIQWYSYPELQLILAATGWKANQLITDLEPDKAPHPDAHILTITATKI